MNRTLFALWAIIFGSVLALIALVVVSTRQREAQSKLDLSDLLRNELDVYNRDIRQLFEQYDRQLQQAFEGFDPQSSGAVLKLERHPLCGLVVIVDDKGLKGEVRHPEQIANGDRSLVEDVVTWIRDSNFTGRDSAFNSYQQVAQAPATQSSAVQAISQSAVPQPASPQPAPAQLPTPNPIKWLKRSSGQLTGNDATQSIQNALVTSATQWTTWYHGRGLVLGYWVQSLHETITMVIVPRGRWLADLVGVLPDNSQPRLDALVQLVDVEGAVVSQWGNLELASAEVTDAELQVSDPLEGWRLRMTLTPEARSLRLGSDNRWLQGLTAASFSLVLILLGAIITTSINRQLRLAKQQVSFVNQVSHELRTPLTNIRMYTELAMQGLEAHRDLGIEGEMERLTVIQHETTRLGRLIENVLTYARSGKQRPLRTSLVENAENLIDGVLATFEPQLCECEIAVERQSQQIQPLYLDQEAVEQILVNLISNAIKYASVGKVLRIETSYGDQQLTVQVSDNGPGIPKRLRRRVFEPFVRGSNRLEAPAGTGIGLSIARQLARQHGGDLKLVPSPTGCTFEVTIRSIMPG